MLYTSNSWRMELSIKEMRKLEPKVTILRRVGKLLIGRS